MQAHFHELLLPLLLRSFSGDPPVCMKDALDVVGEDDSDIFEMLLLRGLSVSKVLK